MTKDVLYRTTAILTGVILPIVMILFYPDMKSLSAFWETPFVSLFIIMNVVTAVFFFTLDNWRLPAILLVAVTAFPVTFFGHLHNILAISFFVSAGYAVLMSKRFSWLSIFFVFAIILSVRSLLWAEILAIDIISFYHGLVLWKREKINKKRLDNI